MTSPAAALLQRYRDVFTAAWRERKTMDAPARSTAEREFLPAALALQETPPHPLPRRMLWTLLALVGVALLWSIFGRVDVMAVAPGKIIPDGRSKTVQSLDVATVRKIHVRDGQQVKAGDPLIDLDATVTGADRDRTRELLAGAKLEAARVTALLTALDGPNPPRLPPVAAASAAQAASQQQLAISQWREYDQKVATFDAELDKREAELKTLRHMIAKLEQTVQIAQQRATDYRDLVQKNFISKHGLLEREQERIEKEGDLAQSQARAKELEAGIRSARANRASYVAEFRSREQTILKDAEARAGSLEQELVAAERRNELMRIVAPVDGTVQQLAVTTEGGVVTEAQALLAIAPADAKIEVEAMLPNKDVGFVRGGQDARIKVESYPFTRYGTVDGTVRFVSGDAIADEKKGLVYQTRVALARNTMEVDGKTVALSPGMAVTVEIKTGRRRIAEYFFTPIAQRADEAFRER
jgi:hemolysin D